MVDTPDQDDEVAFILGLSQHQVKAAATGLGHDSECPTCKKNAWALASHEGKPCILNIPLVNIPGLAAWYFSMQCLTCGHCKLISASVIADQAKSMETADGQ